MANSLVSLNLPVGPYSADQLAIQRQQKLADLLTQQGQQAPQQFSYNGIQAVTPPTAYLAKIADQLLGVLGNKKAQSTEMALGQKAQSDATNWIKGLTQSNPETPGSVTATPSDVADRDQGIAMGSGAAPMDAGQQIPVAGGQGEGANIGSAAGPISGPQRMAMLLQGMQNPLTSGAAGSMLANEQEQQRQSALMDKQFGQQTAMQGQSQTFQAAQAELARAQQAAMQNNTFSNQKALQQASENFQAAQAQANRDFQKSMGTPIAVPDASSPTGFKYARPQEAIGMPAFNDKSIFGFPGAMPPAAAMPPGGGLPPLPNAGGGAPNPGIQPAQRAAPPGMSPEMPPSPGAQPNATVPNAAPLLQPGMLDAIPTTGTGPQLPVQSSAVNPAVLQSMPPNIAATVKGIAQGDIQVSSAMMRTPQGMQILGAVKQYDPTFNAGDYTSRVALRKNMTSGPYSQQINALNTAIEHGGELADAAHALNNGNWSFKNSVENTLGPMMPGAAAQDLKGRLNQFSINRNAFAEELEKAYRGAGGSEKEIESWKSSLNDADSPVAINAGIQKGLRLLNGKLDSLAQTYNQGMGTSASGLQMLSPKAAAIYSKLAGNNPVGQSGQTPAAAASNPSVIQWQDLK